MKVSKSKRYRATIGQSFAVGEFKIEYQRKPTEEPLLPVSKSADVIDLLRQIWPRSIDYIECSMMLMLNRANRLVAWTHLSTGGTSGTLIDVKVIMQHALLNNSECIILAHNHPSGQLKASNADKEITAKVKAAGRSIDITLIDHIIITSTGYYSLADEGEL